MPTSTPRKPADRRQKAQKGTVTSASDWKKNSKTGKTNDLELPSGNVAKVKNVQITELLEKGVLPDSLEQLIAKKISAADGTKTEIKAPDAAETEKALANPKELAKLMLAVDRITAMAVVEPQVLLGKVNVNDGLTDAKGEPLTEKWEDIPDEDRDEDALYADEVDLEDKMFIFQYTVGGTKDVESFREQFGAGLGDMGNGEGLLL